MNAVAGSGKNVGVALQLGGSHAVAQLFEFLDGTIRRLGSPIKGTQNEADSVAKQAMAEANRERGNGLAAPIPVAVSWAGPVASDNRTATPVNFSFAGKVAPDTVNVEEHLSSLSQAEGGSAVRAHVANDAIAQMQAAVLTHGDGLRLAADDKVYHVISGTGMGGAGAELGSDSSSLRNINANEPGHARMPYLHTYELIEGTARQKVQSAVSGNKGFVELYTAGGNTDDRGLRATLANMREIARSGSWLTQYLLLRATLANMREIVGDLPKLNQAVALLNETLAGQGISHLKVSSDDVLHSPVITNTNTTNEEVTKSNDKFARAISAFTLIRASQAFAHAISSQGDSKPIAMMTVSGGFNKGLREAVDPGGTLQFKVLTEELRELGHPGIKGNDPSRVKQFNPELDGTPVILEHMFRA